MLVWRIPSLLLFLSLIYKVSCHGSSLTFVIDKTGSMGDDIAQVRSEVDSIMDFVLDKRHTQISNIGLVTFDDPDDPELRIMTNKREKLTTALQSVRLGWGGDCEELALGGIKLGLESSLPGSYIYVFTDASAKDYYMSEEIQQLCQRKQSQIVFVLTGDCGDPNAKNYQVYYTLSTACSGLVIDVPKLDVHTVLSNFLKVDVSGNKTGLTSQLTPANVKTEVPFWVDELTKYVILSASGTYVQLFNLIGPALTVEPIISKDHAKVIKLANTKPGQYVVSVKSTTVTSVVITGRSDFNFRHGFSEQRPKSPDDTTPQPFSDTLTHLSFLVTDPNDLVRVQSAQILDMKENVIKEMLLTEIWPNFYTTEMFVAPSEMFKVALTGKIIESGNTVRRIAKIPVTPQKPPPGTPAPKAPVVHIVEGASIEVARDSPVTLTCKVAAYPEPEITWRNELGIRVQSESSRLQIPYDYISYLNITRASEDRYFCHAKNYYGKHHQSIQVIIKDPFIIQAVPKDTTRIAYKTESTLTCDVRSKQPLKVRWYRDNQLTGVSEHVTSSEKYTTSPDGTQLKILSMDIDLVGKYTCKAYLLKDPTRKREFSTNVEIIGLVPPKIDPDTQTIQVPENMPATIKCKILEGMPEPEISWLMKATGSLEYQSIPGTGSELSIEKATLAKDGYFKCVAKNVAGHDEQVVSELIVLKAPTVTVVEGARIKVPYGSQLTLTCRVKANPEATVAWMDGAGNTLTAPSSAVKSANNMVSLKSVKSGFEHTHTITRVNMKASGKYSCSAKNDQGSATASIQVSVSSPFRVYSHSPDSINVKYGTEVNLKCRIISNLPMKIRWYHIKSSTNEKKEIETSEQYTILSNGATLKIKTMDVGLDGKYTCKASLLEDANKHVEYTKHVQIYGLEVPKVMGVQYQKVIMGTSVSVKCNVVKGVPKPELSWQFKPTNSSDFTNISNTGNEWRTSNATTEHSGYYRCTATNNQGTDEHIVQLIVQVPARIVSDQFVYEGMSGDVAMRVPCDTIGYPKPIVSWDVNGSSVTPDEKYNIEDDGLIIRNPTKNDNEHSYTCTATNDVNTDNKTFVINIVDKMTDYGDNHNLYILMNDSAKLTCGRPLIDSSSVQWFVSLSGRKDGTDDLITDEPYLSIDNADDSDDGNYTCHISDVHGSATETFIVDVGYPPKFRIPQKGPIVFEWDGEPDDPLTCGVAAKPPADYEWTFNGGKPMSGGSDMNLTTYKWGRYKCKASNVHGTVEREFDVIH